MKGLIAAVLFLISSLAFALEPIDYRSVDTGFGEHLVISGYVFEDMTVMRVSEGKVQWVEKVSASCGTLDSFHLEDFGLYMIIVTEGMWETTVLMDEFGYIRGFRVRVLVPYLLPATFEECFPGGDDAEEAP